MSSVETTYRGFHLLVHPLRQGDRLVNAMKVNGDLLATRPGNPYAAMTQLRKTVDAFLAEEVAPQPVA